MLSNSVLKSNYFSVNFSIFLQNSTAQGTLRLYSATIFLGAIQLQKHENFACVREKVEDPGQHLNNATMGTGQISFFQVVALFT